MTKQSITIRVYTMPQEMPCGPASSCCGPVGQTEEVIEQMRWGLEHSVPGAQVEVINIRQYKFSVQRDQATLKVIHTFGPAALPVLAVDGEVVSIGPPNVPELVARLRAKVTSPTTTKVV